MGQAQSGAGGGSSILRILRDVPPALVPHTSLQGPGEGRAQCWLRAPHPPLSPPCSHPLPWDPQQGFILGCEPHFALIMCAEECRTMGFSIIFPSLHQTELC